MSIRRALGIALFEFSEGIRFGGALVTRTRKQWEEEYPERRKRFFEGWERVFKWYKKYGRNK